MRGSDERTGELFNCLSYARIMLLFVEGGAFLGRPVMGLRRCQCGCR